MANSTITFTYTATARGQSVASLLAAAQAVPLDLDGPRTWGLLPAGDIFFTSGLTVTRGITLLMGSIYAQSSGITLDKGATASPIEKVTPGGGVHADYAAPPIASFTDSAGKGATAAAVMGVGTGFLIAGGSGYTSAPTAKLVGGQLDPKGKPAQVTVTVAAGAVTGLTISDPGNGYNVFPEVVMTGGGGTGARMMAALKPVSFLLGQKGNGYKAPTLNLTPFFPFNTPDSSNQAGIVKGYMLSQLQDGTSTPWSEAIVIT